MHTGMELEVTWWDDDVVKFVCRCSNGRFSGQADIYVSHNDLPRMAESLSGFPFRADDSRDFELGTFDPKCAGGGIQMHFYCRDSVGHAAVDVRLRAQSSKALGEVESVALRIPLEAAAIDSFVAQARRLQVTQGARIHLSMASA